MANNLSNTSPDYHHGSNDPFFQTEGYRKAVRKLAKYGLTVKAHDELIFAQDWHCAGCVAPLQPETMKIDHCHKTGVVRGLLCHHCNITLGWARDRSDTLRNLAVYLDSSAPRKANDA